MDTNGSIPIVFTKYGMAADYTLELIIVMITSGKIRR